MYLCVSPLVDPNANVAVELEIDKPIDKPIDGKLISSVLAELESVLVELEIGLKKAGIQSKRVDEIVDMTRKVFIGRSDEEKYDAAVISAT